MRSCLGTEQNMGIRGIVPKKLLTQAGPHTHLQSTFITWLDKHLQEMNVIKMMLNRQVPRCLAEANTNTLWRKLPSS